MKGLIKRIIRSDYFPFIVLGAGMLVIHFLAPIPLADDIFFQQNPNNVFDWAFFSERYFHWSSRLIIEFFLVLLLKTPYFVWRILNTGVLVLLGVSISKLVVENDKRMTNWVIAFFLCMIPFNEMHSAGWVTTSLNYLWPLALGLYAISAVKDLSHRNKKPLNLYILATVSLIFALNHEIMAVIISLVFITITFNFMIKKKLHWFIVFCLVLCLASLIFALTAPGNSVRSAAELQWFVDFKYLSLIEKMEIGVSSTLAQHIFIFNFIFSLFSLLLMFAVHAKYKDTLYRVFAVIPLAMSLVFGNGFYVIVDRLFPHLASIDTEMTKYGLITLGNFTRVQSYIPLLLLLTTSMLVIILMYLIFGNTRKSLLALGILLSGFISRIILSFSPTIWVSGIRTHLVLIISMILCCIMVFQFLCQAKSHRFIQNLFIFIGMIAGFSYLNLIMSF